MAKTEDVKEVIKVMQNSPTAAYIRECSLHERIMLAALLKCIRKEGVEEVKWGDVSLLDSGSSCPQMQSFESQVQTQHVIYSNILTGDDDPARRPTFEELNCVLDSLLASRAMLMEDGLVAQRKPEGERRVVLNLEQTEVERVLGEMGGQRWKNALGV
jgi:origin recognition complex subunit 1